MNIIKQVAVLIVIGAIAAGGYYGWEKYGNASAGKAEGPKRKGPPVIGVEVAKAEMRKIDTIVEAVGTTRAVRSINVTPLSSGRVVEVGFKAGEPVKANDVLLRLDAEVQRANLTEAEAKLKEANSALKRSSILQRQKAVSEAALERLIAQAEIAKAERDRAAKQLRDKIVRAPFAGSIGLSNVDPGALVKEGEVIAVLDDLSSVEVEFSVPENLFGVLRIGDKVQARAAPFPDREFTGTIAALDTRIDSVSRAFKVRGLIANEDKALPAGMFVHVGIVLDGSDALSIPEEAVVVDGSRAFVFAVVANAGGGKGKGDGKADGKSGGKPQGEGGKPMAGAKPGGGKPGGAQAADAKPEKAAAKGEGQGGGKPDAKPDAGAKAKGGGNAGAPQKVERRLVTLGRRSFGYVEVTDGIKLGEAVVVRGVQKVRDGALVSTGRPGGGKKPDGKAGATSDKPMNTPAQPPAN